MIINWIWKQANCLLTYKYASFYIIHNTELRLLQIIIITAVFKVKEKGRRGHDRMVVRFTTTYPISVYHY